MTKEEALELIDNYKNGLIDPADLLHWTWLRVIVAQLTKDEWERALERALPILAR